MPRSTPNKRSLPTPASAPCPSSVPVQKLPRVDVGSLEEVIGRMEGDEKGEWSDVVFVPARSVAGVAPPAPKK